MEEPGRLQPMGSQRIRRNLATEQVIFIDIYMTWLSVHVYVHLCLCMSNMYVCVCFVLSYIVLRVESLQPHGL